MGLGSLRRYDVQARYAQLLAIVAAVPCVAALVLVLRNYDHQLGQIVYGAKSPFLPVLLGCVAVSMLPAAVAFFLGLSSAGQRRNETPGRSWFGFFLGGFVVTLDMIIMLSWYMLKFVLPG